MHSKTKYKQTLEYLYAQLPMFHRIGAAAYKANLDNTLAIMNLLQHPECKFRSLHIAGTNGKGSTSHMLASIFQEAGYKTGLYTSPHLKDFRERIRVNGKMIPHQKVIGFVELYKKDFEIIKPSFFEWTVGLAFDYFRNENVDIAIIETGLGGRLDSTNVIKPELSVITNISYDHTNLLGNTLEKIAAEKAGIIKKNTPVIISEKQKQVSNVFESISKKQNADLYFAESLCRVKTGKQVFSKGKLFFEGALQSKIREIDSKKIKCDLPGAYQQKNIPGVISAALLMKEKGFNISFRTIFNGIKNTSANTGLQGRWHLLNKQPLTICDTAHNESGIREVLKMFAHIPYTQLHFVIGMVGDKDIMKVLALLPKQAQYYFCNAKIPRAMPSTTLQETGFKHGLYGQSYKSVRSALLAAQKNAKRSDLIFIGGSTFTVAEII